MHFIQRKSKQALKPCVKLINNEYMLEQQKEYEFFKQAIQNKQF